MFYSFLRIQPTTVGGAFRLYLSYAAALIVKITRLKHRISGYQIPGAFVPGKSFMRVKVDGVLATVRPRTGDLVLVAGYHEPLTASWFKVEPDEVVVDVGAHIGCYSLKAAHIGAKVIAIEPDSSNFELLKYNVRLNGFRNVEVLNVAASDKRGRVVLYPQTGDNTGTSSLEPDWTPSAKRETYEVEGSTLDEIVESRHIGSVDWLKVDVEGHEVPTLLGARKTLAMTANLIIEVSQGRVEECVELIRNSGLEIKAVESGAKVSNWLCSRPEWLDARKVKKKRDSPVQP
jgi:FkbM family methyltransferase